MLFLKKFSFGVRSGSASFVLVLYICIVVFSTSIEYLIF